MEPKTGRNSMDIEVIKDKLNTLIAERKEGIPDRDIAKKHGYSNVSAMRHHMDVMKMIIRTDQMITARTKREAGYSVADIALEMGVSEASVLSLLSGFPESLCDADAPND